MLRKKTLRKAIAMCLGITLIPSLLFAGVNIPGYYGNVTLPAAVANRPSAPPAGVKIPGFYGSTTLPAVAPTQLPVLKTGGALSGVTAPTTAAVDGSAPGTTIQKMTIGQYQEQAIIDWQSFNIGQDSWVYFEQKLNGVAQPNWSALNRIWDISPSQILGRLTADGKIYLINQNGILFGPGSSVNVHTLVASSLNMAQTDFMNNLLKFNRNNESVNGELFYDSTKISGAVSNHGIIETDELGSVFLIAPTVENSGIISSPVGQIGLVGAYEAEMLLDPSSTTRTVPVVRITGTPGEATNFENGWLIANTGLAGMYGRLVNQDGLVMAVTAVKKAGAIELHASEKVSTGPKSYTLSPITDSTETVHQSFVFNGGNVYLGGLMQANYDANKNLSGFENTPTSRIEHRGAIDAPSGMAEFRATDRIYFEKESKVDVSGLWVNKPASANVLEAQLNSVELRDDYGQKNGLLKGQKIWFDALCGSAVGDVSGSFSQEISAREHALKGGQVFIDAGEGDVIVRDGAEIRFAGGGFRYAAGMIETTALMAGTKTYSISAAPQWINYDTLTTVTSYVGERVEGSDAGSLSIASKRMVLDGRLDGSVVKGQYQTQAEESLNKSGNQNSKGKREPRGGMVLIGTIPVEGRLPENESFRINEVIVSSAVNPLPQSFGPGDPIPPEYSMGRGGPDVTILSAQTLSDAGLGRLEIYANTLFRIDEGAHITLPSSRFFDEKKEPEFATKVGGYFSGGARRIEIFGSVDVPAGEIIMRLKSNKTALEEINGVPNPLYRALQQRIFLGAGSRLIANTPIR